MIVLITGGVGTGKTCYLVRCSLQARKMGKMVLCNFTFFNIEYKKMDLTDLYLNYPDLTDIFLAYDEFYTEMDCRVSGKLRNRLQSYLIAQTRKKNCDLYATAQFNQFMDLRLIKFVDIWAECRNVWIIQNEKIRKHPFLFDITVHDYRTDPYNPIDREFRFDGRRYFSEYDTNELILPREDYIYEDKKIKKIVKEGSKNR